ncbi:MAG: hypothetical protein R2834_16950 [Rhodothermales bacterium]
MRKPRHNASRLLLVIAVLALGAPAAALAQDASTCLTQRLNAERAYYNGEFDRAIALFSPCIEAGMFRGDDAVMAHTLAARSYIALGEQEKARELIASLFLLNPDYTPDQRLPPPFRVLIAEVKTEMLADGRLLPPGAPVAPVPDTTLVAVDSLVVPTPVATSNGSRRRFLLIGGAGAAALGVTTAILLSGGEGGEPGESGFAVPPGRPTGQ